MEPGIYDISNAEYHASSGISKSAIMVAKNSTLDYYHAYIERSTERKQTAAMALGSLLHTLTLEPHNFESEYMLYEKATGTGSVEINKLAKLKSGNKTIISIELYQQAREMVKAIKDHSLASQLLAGASYEKSFYWINPDTGLLCKSRPDVWHETLGFFVELKKAVRPRLRDFTRQADDLGYHIQAAMQIDAKYGVKNLPTPDITSSLDDESGMTVRSRGDDVFAFIVVPENPPYKPYIYELDFEDIEMGRQEYINTLKVIKSCQETGKWDADRDAVMKMSFNNWQRTNNNSISKIMGVYNV
jgi:hypothetical protein